MSIVSSIAQFANFLITAAPGVRLLMDYITPEIPGAQGAGDPLQRGDIDANTARQGSVVPEWWGARKRFPDKIVASHSYYADKRIQVTENALCVGWGEYDIPRTTVRIGSTPLDSLGADADFDLYSPGADVSGDSRFDCWYNAPEVGGTSSGAGLDLASTQPSGSSVIADSVQFNGDSATLYSADTPEYPDSWIVGTAVNIRAPKDAVVTEVSGYSEVVGDWQDIEPFVGMKVTLSTASQDFSLVVLTWTDNSGVSDVLTFTDDLGNPFNSAFISDGGYRIAIGYRGNQYKLTAVGALVVSFDRLTDTGAIDSSWGGFTNRTITDFDFTSDEAGDANWIGPFFTVPENETTDTIELDFYFPQGLIQYDKDDGDSSSLSLDIVVEWRDSEVAGTWAGVAYTLSDKTADAIGFTRTIDTGSQIRPQIRVRRDQAEENTKYKRRQWKCQWQRLKSKLQARPDSYTGITTMGVTVRSGDRLAAITENQISIVGTRQIGGSDANTISGFLEYVTDVVGMPAAQKDSAKFTEIEDEYWTPRGETFDYTFDTQMTVEESIDMALTAGMSQRVDRFGVVSAHREGIQDADGSLAITPHHLLSDLQVSMPMQSDEVYDGVDVKYIDPNTWKTETVECRPATGTVSLIEQITVDGVQDRDRAWRIGQRRREKNIAQRYSVSGETNREIRNSSIMQRVTVTDDMTGLNGQSAEIWGMVDGGTNATITVRERLDYSGLTNPRVILIDQSGERGVTITPVSVSDYSVVVASSLVHFTPDNDYSIDRPTLMLCESTQLGYDILITEITPNSLQETKFSGVEYSDDFYQFDDISAPEI